MAEVFADPQVVARGIEARAQGIPTVRPPFRFSAAETVLDRPSPKLDEDGPAIRARLRARDG
jgi:crotonobetainyl-CoA:carnitine CoA-transferase CaiB-like acyl-CoA transferase